MTIYGSVRSESPSSMRAKLRTVAASNNRDHTSRSLSAYAIGYMSRSIIHMSVTAELTRHDHFIIACSRHVYIYMGVATA